MKRAHEDPDDVAMLEPFPKRVRQLDESARKQWFFSLLPLEIWEMNILPATTQTALVRALLRMTSPEATSLLGSTRNARKDRLFVDLAILAGSEWRAVAEWSLSCIASFSVSALTTLDAAVAMNDSDLVAALSHHYSDFPSMSKAREAIVMAIPEEQREARRAYFSPLDMASYHGSVEVLQFLQFMNYPSICLVASLNPCAETGNSRVLDWVASVVGLSFFFELRPGGWSERIESFCRAIGKHGQFELMTALFDLLRYRGLADEEDDEDVRISPIMNEAAKHGQIAMLDQCLAMGCSGKRIIKEAAIARQMNVLRYCVDRIRDDPDINLGQQANGLREYALQSNDAAVISFVDQNIQQIQPTDDDLNSAYLEGDWETLEWLIDTKGLSGRPLNIDWDRNGTCHADDCWPTLLPWLVKRGARYSLATISWLLEMASHKRWQGHKYPYELWMADHLFDNYPLQCIDPELTSDLFFYDTRNLLPQHGWDWGLKKGLPFPSTPKPWMKYTNHGTSHHITLVNALGALQ